MFHASLFTFFYTGLLDACLLAHDRLMRVYEAGMFRFFLSRLFLFLLSLLDWVSLDKRAREVIGLQLTVLLAAWHHFWKGLGFRLQLLVLA